MIYNKEYKVKFYKNITTGESPVLEYLQQLSLKSKQKVNKYIDVLCNHDGYLDEPYSRHITGKIRELRVDFANNRHRILYFAFVNKEIILLHAFLKKTAKTPVREIEIAVKRYDDFINNYKLYG